ncbi:MAG: aldose 1-epimerase [Leptospiraceae bacterium]|nr:aldose 1-epimerase [Leptospiraceae bacterium]MCK6381650.1 aldose 1-epimerase [Leptospiraceae bacterium]NUM41080.1 aldose 1-epimerase [Leptospiraceae bacterium]
MIKEINTGCSYFALNLQEGGQWMKLGLKSPFSNEAIDVIKGYDKSKDFFISGCFFMFPFVNRSEYQNFQFQNSIYDFSNAKKDSNNFPIHGLICDTPRKIFEERSEDTTKINITSENPLDTNLYPLVVETYELSESKLTITTMFKNTSLQIQYFAFGYHPYFCLGDSVDDCYIETNLAMNYPLNEKLLPDNQSKPEKLSLQSSTNSLKGISWDNTLAYDKKEMNPFLSIINKNKNLQLMIHAPKKFTKDSINYNFFQLYTPPDRKSIAVEPLSSTGNSFFYKKASLIKMLPNETKTAVFGITLNKYPTSK